jgi:hypothetical protein
MSTFSPNETQLQNYIQNKLSDAEVEQVELWLADHSEVLADLEMEVMFEQGIDKSSLREQNKNQSWWYLFFEKPIMAVSFALIFSLGILFSNFVLLPQSKNMISNPDVLMFEQMRGTQTHYIVYNNNDVLIQIPVDYLSENTYSMKISDDKGTNYQLKHIKPEADIVSMLIPKDLLSKGDYKLVIVNEKSKDKSSYNFEIR